MSNAIPFLEDKYKICIICEGAEEYDYLAKLNELKVWNDVYSIDLVSADGNGNIPAIYQSYYQNDGYDLILIFCDTDKKPNKQYIKIKDKIDNIHGIDGSSEKVIIFANPCTMQIIIKHFSDVVLKTQAKKMNAPIIEQCTGVKDYDAKSDERKQLMSLVDNLNFNSMRFRVKNLSMDDSQIGSSNFSVFVERLLCPNASWISEINNFLNS